MTNQSIEQQEYSFHRYANIFPMMSADEFQSLVEDLREFGLRDKIWLFQGQILDGRNRYIGCQKAGIIPVFQTFRGTEESALQAVLSWNLERRHLSSSQKAAVGVELEPLFDALEAQAKERQLATLKQNQVDTVTQKIEQRIEDRNQHESGLTQKIEQVQKDRNQNSSTHKAAKTLGTNRQYISDAKKLKETAPKIHEAVKRGDANLNQAKAISKLPEEKQAKILQEVAAIKDDEKKRQFVRSAVSDAKREERLDKIEEIATGNEDLADTGIKYPVIYADPPWRYEHVKTESRAIENQYPTMALDEICALPLDQITTDDAILFLWTTAPKLEESFRVIQSWGFTYRSCAIWDKKKIGMGYYFRIQHEILLIATKGAIPTPSPSDRVSSVVSIDSGKHSAKPSYFAELIEKWYPSIPKLEMFCRTPRKGWGSWGNQSNG